MICSKCGEDKPKYHFYQHKDGSISWCIACRSRHKVECKKSKEKLSRKLLRDDEVYPSWFSYNAKVYNENKKMIDKYRGK